MRGLSFAAFAAFIITAAPRLASADTIYLHRGGATLTAGWDDSARDVSSIASRSDDGTLVVPAWRGGDRRWREVVACVRDGFGDFAIDIVDKRPARGDYMMVVVGGSPDLVGHGRAVSGIAPYTGELIPRGVAFVFPAYLRNDVRATCSSILHESGHLLGLDHAYLCEDPMSYLSGCGEKRFRNVEAPCGEDEERECGDGNATQNSYVHLARTVGLRGSPDVSEPEPEPELEPESEVAVTLDPPTIENDVLTVTARATSARGVTDVFLLWANGDDSYGFACSNPGTDVVACKRSGDRFTFRLRVGTGKRGMAATAIDRAGNHATTDARWVWLSE